MKSIPKIEIKKLKRRKYKWMEYSIYISGEQCGYASTREEAERKARSIIKLKKYKK